MQSIVYGLQSFVSGQLKSNWSGCWYRERGRELEVEADLQLPSVGGTLLSPTTTFSI